MCGACDLVGMPFAETGVLGEELNRLGGCFVWRQRFQLEIDKIRRMLKLGGCLARYTSPLDAQNLLLQFGLPQPSVS